MENWEKIDLYGAQSTPETYLLRSTTPLPGKRPVMLVAPGGGYSGVCHAHEGFPIAAKFEGLGFRVFVVNYRVAPSRFPQPQQDLARAIRLIRFNADKWGAKADNLAICGFSAGGHLCASLGTLFDEIPNVLNDEIDALSCRPDAMVLGYPVISADEEICHGGSFQNLLGERFESDRALYSLEKRVAANSSPAFLWHTVSDQVVDYRNSVRFAEAMVKAHVPVSLHLFPRGPHGMALGFGNDEIAKWPEMTRQFFETELGFAFPHQKVKGTVVLTFDDATKSQVELALPLLMKYNFRATFFICRFSDEWRSQHEANLMTKDDVLTLRSCNMEIGNHTWSHPGLGNLSPEAFAAEVDKMEEWLLSAGWNNSQCVSFAYPGGPYFEYAANILKEKGYNCARAAEKTFGAWTRETDLMHIPCKPLQHGDDEEFFKALSYGKDGDPVVLLYHGVPDRVHAHVNTDFADFARQMKYLYENGYEVITMQEALRRFEEDAK